MGSQIYFRQTKKKMCVSGFGLKKKEVAIDNRLSVAIFAIDNRLSVAIFAIDNRLSVAIFAIDNR